MGSLDRNHLLPTAVGALRPSALVPETMAAGDAASGRAASASSARRALRDFHAAPVRGQPEAAGIDARAVDIELEVERADENALGLARRFDDPAWRAAFAARLALKLQADERVGLPAMLGIRDPHGAWSDLEHRLGPAGVRDPDAAAVGSRACACSRSCARALRRAGGRLVLGAEVVDCERDGVRG